MNYTTETYTTKVFRRFDVPPWVCGLYRKPRFARLRWFLRRVWPIQADPIGGLELSVLRGLERDYQLRLDRRISGIYATPSRREAYDAAYGDGACERDRAICASAGVRTEHLDYVFGPIRERQDGERVDPETMGHG
jgi:hypothetical protein